MSIIRTVNCTGHVDLHLYLTKTSFLRVSHFSKIIRSIENHIKLKAVHCLIKCSMLSLYDEKQFAETSKQPESCSQAILGALLDALGS